MKQHHPRCLSTHGLEPGSGGHKVVVRYRLSTDNYTMFLRGKKKERYSCEFATLHGTGFSLYASGIWHSD